MAARTGQASERAAAANRQILGMGAGLAALGIAAAAGVQWGLPDLATLLAGLAGVACSGLLAYPMIRELRIRAVGRAHLAEIKAHRDDPTVFPDEGAYLREYHDVAASYDNQGREPGRAQIGCLWAGLCCLSFAFATPFFGPPAG